MLISAALVFLQLLQQLAPSGGEGRFDIVRSWTASILWKEKGTGCVGILLSPSSTPAASPLPPPLSHTRG